MTAKYARPQIEDWVETPERALDLSEKQMGVVLHLLARFKAKIVRQVRDLMNIHKEAYDNDGEAYKTPFMLRNIGENPDFPLERSMVLTNVVSFSSNYGCTGCCGFCGVDAMPVKFEDVISIPLEQQKHFYDEMICCFKDISDDPRFLKQVLDCVMCYMDSDPFDDPEISKLINYLLDKYGTAQCISTYLPAHGFDAFSHYAELEKRHLAFGDLVKFEKLMMEWGEKGRKYGVNSVQGFLDLMNNLEYSNILRRLVGVMGNLKVGNHDDSSRAFILSENNQIMGYQCALDHFGLGELSDYYGCTDENIANLDRGIVKVSAQEQIDFEEWRQLFHAEKKVFKHMEDYYEIDSVVFEFTDESFAELRKFIEEESVFLKENSSVGPMRVSETKRTASVFGDLVKSKKHFFRHHKRDVKTGGVSLLGERFVRSGEEGRGVTGITTSAGVDITPFGVFSAVPLEVTPDYPQGKLLVPYLGLCKENELAQEGSDLGELLSTVVVLADMNVMGDGFQDCFVIYVYDGDSRVRRIWYNRKNATVIIDQIVKENITSLLDLAPFKMMHWGDWAFSLDEASSQKGSFSFDLEDLF